jgi:glycerol-3-phosphate dehydrogenase (NAD+)
MWVFEETLPSGALLSETVNRTHENPKYLPGVVLPPNLRAVPELLEACREASHLVFVVPHQFLLRTCTSLQQAQLQPQAKAISLIKGMDIDPQDGPKLLSHNIAATLGISCAVLMGANVAAEVARGEFCEATIGVDPAKETGDDWLQLFHHPHYFRCNAVRFRYLVY